MPSASADARLVEQAKDGDHDAFARLAADAVDRMHTLASLILRDPGDAEDAVQEALVSAWRELHRLRDADRFDAWLRRLLVNACHDVGRRRRRHIHVSTAIARRPVALPDGWHRIEEAAAWVSANGTTWTRANDSPSFQGATMTRVVWTGTTFLAMGRNEAGDGLAWVSTSGFDWTPIDTIATFRGSPIVAGGPLGSRLVLFGQDASGHLVVAVTAPITP